MPTLGLSVTGVYLFVSLKLSEPPNFKILEPGRAVGIAAAFLALGIGVVFSGRWWALRGSRLRAFRVLLAAFTYGLFLAILFMAIYSGSLAWVGQFLPFNLSDVLVTGILWDIFSVWTLLLGLTIRWRLSRAYHQRLAQRRKATASPSVFTTLLPPSRSLES